MKKLKSLQVVENVSEAFQVTTNEVVVIQITTSESSDVVLKTSVDGVTFSTNANFAETIDGTAEYNIPDLAEGQYVEIEATTGTLSAVKILG